MFSWKIVPVKSGTLTGLKWHWEKTSADGATVVESAAQFDYYYDCVTDAKAHGYVPPPPERLR